MKKIKQNWLLVVIFLLAGFLRFYQLGSNPPALSWDEAAWGYNAYSLGLDGRDEFGRLLPLDYFESFGDFKPPVYAYLTVLPVKLFGLNEFATRFASAFFGSLTILLTYFLVKEIFSPRCLTLPLIAALLLAVSPWHIMLSRTAFEANVASFFLIAGVTFFLVGVRQKNWFLALSAASFGLSMHTFNTARILAPILVLVLTVAFRKQLWQQKKQLALAGVIGFLILLPAIPFLFTPQAKLRFKEVNIFSDPSVVILANQEMTNDNWAWWSRIIHNRRWGYFRQFLTHYFDHFKPSFLFIKGDGNPKFSTQDVGQLYFWELPFLVAGIFLLLKKRQGYWWLLPVWLLVGIGPAATARETPHALRIETTLPTWQILTALGLVNFWQYAKKQKPLLKNALVVSCCLLALLGFIYFQHGYWRHYAVEFSGEWQYGYEPAIEFIKGVKDEYDEIWFANQLGRPYIYLLYYLQKNPSEFRREAIVERDVFGFVNVRSFDKYHFFRPEETPLVSGRALVIGAPDKIPKDVQVLKTFYLLNGKEVLKAYEII